MIAGIVALYKPKKNEISNIASYIESLDFCFLMDDSGIDNYPLFRELFDKFPNKISYVLNSENLGLVKSVNKGFSLAIDKGADWILVMNPDGKFQKDPIRIYKKFLSGNDMNNVSILCPRFNIDRRPKEAGNGLKRVKYPDMSGCLYNAKVLKKIGYFDEKTYFYGLDLEYCIRAIESGYKILECSELVLNHKPGNTFELKFWGHTFFRCGIDVPQRYYYQFRSAYYIFKKYKNFYCFAFHVYKFFKVILFFKNKAEYIRMMHMGIYDAKRGFFGNISERPNNCS